MAFLKGNDREVLQKEFEQLAQPVKLVLFVEEQSYEYCETTKQLLEEIAALSDKISVETFNLQVDKDKAAQFQIDKAPAIAVVNGKDYGIRYFGIPSGYEFSSLIGDILDVS
jgi:alkyl hydroperoxide reductase subunit AhpF